MLVYEREDKVILSWTHPEPGHLDMDARRAADLAQTLFRCCLLRDYPNQLPIMLAGHARPGLLPERHLSLFEALDLAGALFGAGCNVLARSCPPPPPSPAPGQRAYMSAILETHEGGAVIRERYDPAAGQWAPCPEPSPPVEDGTTGDVEAEPDPYIVLGGESGGA